MEFNGRRTTKQINGMTETDNTFPYQKRNENGRLAFAVYLAVAAIFLFITSFQGISHFDIGMYISGYRHFNSDPYTTCFLGRWYLTFHLLGAICNLFGIDTLLGLRLMRIVMLLVLQTIIYLYLRKLIKTKHIIAGLAITMLAQYGAYSEITTFLFLCSYAPFCYITRGCIVTTVRLSALSSPGWW